MARLTNSQVVLLRDSVSRVEVLDDDMRGSQADKKEIYDTAKAAGLDVKQMRAVIRDRRRDPDDIEAENETYSIYAAALDGLTEGGEQGDGDGQEVVDEERAADAEAVPAEEDAGREAGEGAAEVGPEDQEGDGEEDEEPPEPEHPHARLEPDEAEPEGHTAGMAGQPEDDNPCLEPESREAWAAGWNRAQDEIAAEMELAGADAIPDDL